MSGLLAFNVISCLLFLVFSMYLIRKHRKHLIEEDGVWPVVSMSIIMTFGLLVIGFLLVPLILVVLSFCVFYDALIYDLDNTKEICSELFTKTEKE